MNARDKEATEHLDQTAFKAALDNYIKTYLECAPPESIIAAGGAEIAAAKLAATALLAMGPVNSRVRPAFNALVKAADDDYGAFIMATQD